MRWRGLRQSSNVEDRRGGGTSRRFIGGGIGTLVIALIIWLLGGNPGEIFNILSPGGGEQTTTNYQESAEESEHKQFVSVVLAETEDAWTKLFQEKGSNYRDPKLVLYTNSVQSACGFSSAAVGPFYCPGDEKLYLDLSFYDELQKRFHAPGDFAMAYVIAHEVGHHVQNLLGISEKVASLRSRLSDEEYNKYSVRLELQADYFAGVWAHYADRTKQIVEQGDIDEALRAASAVGDDNIQKQSQGYVVPESFTHGTSEQRKKWFYKGYQSGTLEGGDTFSTDNP
ncbi:MAG: neutral zinc metallopeptidase [Syntrophomonadaceae bacterium]